MFKRAAILCLGLCFSFFTLAAFSPDQAKTMGFEKGKLKLKSLDKLTFGPNGVLFLADTGAARIYAMACDDAPLQGSIEDFEIKGLDEKLASMLGTTPKDIYIRDLAIHPASKNAYLAVRRGSGDSASHHLFHATHKGVMKPVALDNVAHSYYQLDGVPAEDAVGRRNRKMRPYAVTSMGFVKDTLFVAGVSNEAFASTVRQIPFPFNGSENKGTIEIYHVAHKQYETHAPVTSLVPWQNEGKDYMIAGFTCTPLVVFPLKDFGNGEKVMGKTVAELGAGNTPVDIRGFEYDGKSYFLIANNRRQLMYVDASDVAKQDGLNTPLKRNWGTKGVPFIALPGAPAQQIDTLDDENLVLIRRDQRGVLELNTISEKMILGIWR